MHQGCVRSRQRRREGAAGWWPTSRNCRWGGRSTTPASWPPTTSSICLATGSPQAAGTAPAPAASGCRAKHRWAGSKQCSRAATRLLGSCWAAPTAATRSRPSTWCCGRPRASPSSTAWGIRPPAGPCCRPITPGWPRRSPTWTSTWAPAGAMAVSSTCPARGCWRSGLTIGHPVRVTRWCTPTGRGQPGPGAGRTLDGLGRPGPVPASAGRGRHLPGHLPAGARPDTGGGVDAGGHPRQSGAPGDARGAGTRVFQARRPDRARGRAAGRGRSGADATAGQVGRPGHPKPKEHEAPDSLYDGGDRRRPSAGWTRTLSSGR